MAVIDYGPQIAALTEAIASGALSVSYEGKSVTYGSFEEMVKRVTYLQRMQARANGMAPAVAGKAGFSRGYYTRGDASGFLNQRFDED